MYRKVICAIDMAHAEKGEVCLRRAASLVDGDGDIVLVNVVEDVPSYIVIDLPQDFVTDAIKDAEQKLTALAKRMSVPALVEVRVGVAANGILAAAKEHDADLIVLTSHVPDLTNYFLGATADRVVRHARCSVLVDRRPADVVG